MKKILSLAAGLMISGVAMAKTVDTSTLVDISQWSTAGVSGVVWWTVSCNSNQTLISGGCWQNSNNGAILNNYPYLPGNTYYCQFNVAAGTTYGARIICAPNL